ncbi:hypothetical protein VRY85_13220 [Achromobacter sp. F4_2707]|uniref:hypothetical protein n=1 Tax=Achromobacter sp. F4_2707 TaxID=3114286 RepID=UPI0039C76009
MSSHSTSSAIAACKTLGSLAVLLTLAACATPDESAARYDTTRENTQLDAQNQGMGPGPRAASQIQLGFGGTGPVSAAPQAAVVTEGEQPLAAAQPRPLAEARSFLGTVPCPAGLSCEAARFAVTLAPSGEWRSRTVLLTNNQPGQTLVDQGCWNVIGSEPLRIVLAQPDQGGTMADLTFLNGNTLRVNMLHGSQPVLEHRLSRQADIDPIDELQGKPAISCS